MGDWVVTPRRGKAVEINALWYNALRLLANWLRGKDSEAARRYDEHAERARVSFNERFWYRGRWLSLRCGGLQRRSDITVDGSCRPNQIFAISLDHPVLDPERAGRPLLTLCKRKLTPVGLRSLSPDDPEYKPIYGGDLRSRDGAYHQGTVWAFFFLAIGPSH